MSKISETGIAVNISNFKLLIDHCVALGGDYNPSNAKLTTANMTTQWTTIKGLHQTVITALQGSKGPINDRQLLFAPTDKLVTRTLGYFRSTEADAEIVADAKGLADKYRGYGGKPKTLADGSLNPEFVSVSHRSYVQKCDTLKQLMELYKGDVNYAPNEVELQVSTLSGLVATMEAMNEGIGGILAPLENARLARAKAMETPKTGLVDVGLDCKDYILGAFGAGSGEYKAVAKIKFTRTVKKK